MKPFKKLLIAAVAGGVMFNLTSCFSGAKKYEDIKEFKQNVTLDELKKVSVTHGELTEVTLYTGGGMLGDSSSQTISKNKNGEIIYIDESSPEHTVPIRGYQYLVKDGDPLKKLQAYIEEYNLSVWDKLPPEEFQALDAPSSSIYMVFDDSEVGGHKRSSHRISYDNVFPEGGSEVLKEFRRLFAESVESKELTETYLLDRDGEKVYSGRNIENTDKEVLLFLQGYWRCVSTAVTEEDGSVQETVYPENSFYYFDYYGWEEEITVQAYNLDDEEHVYKMKKIIHKPLDDCDSSWYIRFVSEGEMSEEAFAAIDGERLYVRMNSPETGQKTVAIFRRIS